MSLFPANATTLYHTIEKVAESFVRDVTTTTNASGEKMIINILFRTRGTYDVLHFEDGKLSITHIPPSLYLFPDTLTISDAASHISKVVREILDQKKTLEIVINFSKKRGTFAYFATYFPDLIHSHNDKGIYLELVYTFGYGIEVCRIETVLHDVGI